MEKVVDNSGSMSVSDKKSSPSSNIDAVGNNNPPTSLKMADAPPRSREEEDLNRPFSDGKTVGPTKLRGGGGGANEVVFDQSRGGVVADEKPSPNNLLQQPFDIFVPADNNASYISAGGMGFPFTQAQWQELARQAMIFKYMISSVPVPHNLLRIALDSSAASSVKYPRNGSDPEPGRCKRTDGKKWRCSRDVAPQQKYCERHLHRGRPRSRKRVEAKLSSSCNTTIDENRKKTRLQQSTNPPKSATRNSSQLVASNLLFNAGTDLTISPSCYKGPTLTHRDLGLSMMGTENTVEEPNVESGNMGFSMYGSTSSVLYNQDYYYMEQQQHQPMDLLSHSKFPISEIEPPTGFVDAWSVDHGLNRTNNEEPSLSPPNHENVSSSLTLSMAMSLGGYEEMERIQVGNDFNRYDYPKTEEDPRRWIGPNSWEPFALGGPLAEALQPNSGSNPTSPPYDSSQIATAVSSPSGVLHRALFSHSDNSACNSPTLGAAQPPETAFRWLN